MRGERSGRRRADPEVRAQLAGVETRTEGPGTLSALMDLARLVGRSRAPWLRTRLTGAILLTLVG